MKRIFALLLAVFVACYPVLAVEVDADDNGHDSELSDVQAPADAGAEVETPVEAVPDVSPVETVSTDDAPIVPDNAPSGGPDADSVSDSTGDVENFDSETPVDVENSDSEDGELDDEDSFDLSLYDSSNPLPVTLVDSEASYSTVTARGSSSAVDIVDDPPDDPPFYGSCYITGTTSNGSAVTLYFPVNYKEGYFGVDSNGYLFNVSSSSISGYYEDAYNNSVSVSGFAYPRYRTTSSSYDYTTLYITPTASNMTIATENAPRMAVSDILPYVSILLLGVIFLCCMRKS